MRIPARVLWCYTMTENNYFCATTDGTRGGLGTGDRWGCDSVLQDMMQSISESMSLRLTTKAGKCGRSVVPSMGLTLPGGELYRTLRRHRHRVPSPATQTTPQPTLCTVVMSVNGSMFSSRVNTSEGGNARGVAERENLLTGMADAQLHSSPGLVRTRRNRRQDCGRQGDASQEHHCSCNAPPSRSDAGKRGAGRGTGHSALCCRVM